MTRSRSAAFLLSGLFVIASTSRQENKLTMSGIVIDSRSHQPVEGAVVSVVGNKANPEITDRDGNFILTFSATTRKGEVVRVRVEKTGYKVYEVNKPVSPTMPLQFSIDRIASTAPPRGTRRDSALTHRLPPLVKEEIWSVLIPFNEGEGDPIPAFRMTQADVEKFPPIGLFYKRISDWSTSALAGRDRPHTPEAVNSFVEEIVRYHVFDWIDQLQHDRYSQSWDYRTGMKSNAILANAPPDFVEYPRSSVIYLISNTPLGRVGDVMLTYWRSRPDSFRVPANSTLQFLTNPENGADVYRIQISNPSLFTLTLSIFHGATLLNYGFVPPQFELTPEAIKWTRSYNVVVKGRLEFKRFSNTDPLLQDEYVKWAEDLFAGLRSSMVADAGSVLPVSIKQRALLLANKLQMFNEERRAAYVKEHILLYPDTEQTTQLRERFDQETMVLLEERFGQDLAAITDELQAKGLDVARVVQAKKEMESQRSLQMTARRLIRFEPRRVPLYKPGLHRLVGCLHMAGAVLEHSRGGVGSYLLLATAPRRNFDHSSHQGAA